MENEARLRAQQEQQHRQLQQLRELQQELQQLGELQQQLSQAGAQEDQQQRLQDQLQQLEQLRREQQAQARLRLQHLEQLQARARQLRRAVAARDSSSPRRQAGPPLKCPVCNFQHRDVIGQQMPFNFSPQTQHACSHGGRLIFMKQECPICWEDYEPLVAFPCGHGVCKPCFLQLGGRTGQAVEHPARVGARAGVNATAGFFAPNNARQDEPRQRLHASRQRSQELAHIVRTSNERRQGIANRGQRQGIQNQGSNPSNNAGGHARTRTANPRDVVNLEDSGEDSDSDNSPPTSPARRNVLIRRLRRLYDINVEGDETARNPMRSRNAQALNPRNDGQSDPERLFFAAGWVNLGSHRAHRRVLSDTDDEAIAGFLARQRIQRNRVAQLLDNSSDDESSGDEAISAFLARRQRERRMAARNRQLARRNLPALLPEVASHPSARPPTRRPSGSNNDRSEERLSSLVRRRALRQGAPARNTGNGRLRRT